MGTVLWQLGLKKCSDSIQRLYSIFSMALFTLLQSKRIIGRTKKEPTVLLPEHRIGRFFMQIMTLQSANRGAAPGGHHLLYLELINEFLHRGWNVQYISPHGFGEIKHEHFEHHGVFRIPIGPRFLSFSIQSTIEALRIGMKEKIDAIVLFNQTEAVAGVIFKLVHRDTKLVVSFHGDAVSNLGGNRVKKALYVPVIKALEQIVLRQADLLMFVSTTDKDTIVERAHYNPADKIKVIYNGVTPRLKELAKAEPVTVAKHKKTVGYVGGLFAEGKGLSYLIRAFQKVKQELTDSALVIVGEGPDRRVLAELAENLNLKDDVIFIGYQENPLQYMKGFDLFVLPSTNEGFSLVLIEAIYVGTPAIASNVGGTPEVLGYEELLFEPRDVRGLAMKIEDLLRDDAVYEKARVLCSQRKKALEFDWGDDMAEAIKDVVQK
jgi:glycosyltransferase involved in cell wall biosynthesis